MQPTDRSVDVIVSQARSHDQGGTAVIATDLGGRILYWSTGAATLYGWPADDAVGRNVLDITPTYTSGDEAARIMERVRRGETWSGSFLMRRRDGQRMLAHVTDVPVFSEGEVVGIVGISRPKDA